MSTVDHAINSVAAKKLPYWKLYKGSVRVSQCDADENPDASPEIALQQFKEELETRPAGNYRVCVYRNLKGEKGGFQYEFSKYDNYSQSSRTTNGGMTPEQIYAQAERDIKMQNSLERIEKKLDALGEFIFSQNDDDDSNDGDALKKLGSFFGMMNQFKGMAAGAGGAATTAAKATGTNPFAKMTI